MAFVRAIVTAIRKSRVFGVTQKTGWFTSFGVVACNEYVSQRDSRLSYKALVVK